MINGRRFASSQHFYMKTISTSKLPGRTLGNLALAGSLFLHVGFIAFFSSWQWDERPLEKAPPKIVQVRFIPDTQSSQTTEAPKSSKPASILPTQPLTTQPNSQSRLIPRTPTLSIPPLPTIVEARQLLRSLSKTLKPSPTQPISIEITQWVSVAIPVNTHVKGQSNVVQQRIQIRQASFSKAPVTLSKTALAMKLPTSGANPIHPLTDPVQSRPQTLTVI